MHTQSATQVLIHTNMFTSAYGQAKHNPRAENGAQVCARLTCVLAPEGDSFPLPRAACGSCPLPCGLGMLFQGPTLPR